MVSLLKCFSRGFRYAHVGRMPKTTREGQERRRRVFLGVLAQNFMVGVHFNGDLVFCRTDAIPVWSGVIFAKLLVSGGSDARRVLAGPGALARTSFGAKNGADEDLLEENF